MTILNCANCGGTHYGSHTCPFIELPCDRIPPRSKQGIEMTEDQLAKIIAQADFIWELGESGVMACNPELAGKMFDEAWEANGPQKQKFTHIAQVVLRNGAFAAAKGFTQ